MTSASFDWRFFLITVGIAGLGWLLVMSIVISIRFYRIKRMQKRLKKLFGDSSSRWPL